MLDGWQFMNLVLPVEISRISLFFHIYLWCELFWGHNTLVLLLFFFLLSRVYLPDPMKAVLEEGINLYRLHTKQHGRLVLIFPSWSFDCYVTSPFGLWFCKYKVEVVRAFFCDYILKGVMELWSSVNFPPCWLIRYFLPSNQGIELWTSGSSLGLC